MSVTQTAVPQVRISINETYTHSTFLSFPRGEFRLTDLERKNPPKSILSLAKTNSRRILIQLLKATAAATLPSDDFRLTRGIWKNCCCSFQVVKPLRIYVNNEWAYANKRLTLLFSFNSDIVRLDRDTLFLSGEDTKWFVKNSMARGSLCTREIYDLGDTILQIQLSTALDVLRSNDTISK